MIHGASIVNMAYRVVQIDLENGNRVEHPGYFPTADEAMEKISLLTDVTSSVSYIVKMVPVPVITA